MRVVHLGRCACHAISGRSTYRAIHVSRHKWPTLTRALPPFRRLGWGVRACWPTRIHHVVKADACGTRLHADLIFTSLSPV
jgi:hypothetical protein